MQQPTQATQPRKHPCSSAEAVAHVGASRNLKDHPRQRPDDGAANISSQSEQPCGHGRVWRERYGCRAPAFSERLRTLGAPAEGLQTSNVVTKTPRHGPSRAIFGFDGHQLQPSWGVRTLPTREVGIAALRRNFLFAVDISACSGSYGN
jgi:hypothetical protein